MLIAVRVNGPLAQRIGRSLLQVEMPANATIADLVEKLQAEYPQAQRQLSIAVPVVCGRPRSAQMSLHEEEELALLMPIAGGASARPTSEGAPSSVFKKYTSVTLQQGGFKNDPGCTD